MTLVRRPGSRLESMQSRLEFVWSIAAMAVLVSAFSSWATGFGMQVGFITVSPVVCVGILSIMALCSGPQLLLCRQLAATSPRQQEARPQWVYE